MGKEHTPARETLLDPPVIPDAGWWEHGEEQGFGLRRRSGVPSWGELEKGKGRMRAEAWCQVWGPAAARLGARAAFGAGMRQGGEQAG